MTRTRSLLLCAAVLLLAGCETFSDLTAWMGSDDADKPHLPGTRIPVLSDLGHPKADDSLSGTDVTIPAVKANDNWRQAGGAPSGIFGNLALSGYAHHDSVKIGDHNGWEQPLYPSPIVAEGVVYAMDAKGYITAHKALDIDTILWTNNSAVTEDEAYLLGGGLAFDSGRVYVTSGRGKLFALDAKTGKELWSQSLGVSLRVAPKASGGKVYALSADNQLFAFEAGKGTPLWSHRGANESAGFLASATPSVTDTVVLAPYSSGELYAVDTVGGQAIWSDTLLLARRNTANGVFSGIGGTPIVKDDIVYAGGSGGFFAAMALLTGRRLWEQDFSTLNTPWIGEDFLYVITGDYDLVCLYRADGRVKWVKPLQQYEDEKKHRHPLVWRGPVMANGELFIAGMHGQMLVLSPKDGATVDTVEIPENITDAPVIAGGRMYFLTGDARLHVLY